MEAAGPLLCKYIIEQNETLQNLTIIMVRQDLLVQWLVGDTLKQDQFRFLYECIKIVFDSALREKLLAGDKIVIESVIPKLVAFKSLMAMRGIQLRKAEELRKAKEKQQKNEAILKANPKLASSAQKKPVAKSKSPGKSKSPSKSPEKSKSPGKSKKAKAGKQEEVEEVVEEKDPL